MSLFVCTKSEGVRVGTVVRPCDVFLSEFGQLLGDHGYLADPGQVERSATGNIVFYHYSRAERLEQIFADGGGLWARLPVVLPEMRPELVGCHLVEGFLEPLPQWVINSPYFGDLGLELMSAYVGNVLLRIELPPNFPGLYVADAAHNFECKHIEYRGSPALNLGYNCATGEEVMRAEANSYIPLTDYHGGHVAPNVKATRYGEGVAIPKEYISICEIQPLIVDE